MLNVPIQIRAVTLLIRFHRFFMDFYERSYDSFGRRTKVYSKSSDTVVAKRKVFSTFNQ